MKKDNKDRPIACTEVLISYNPVYDEAGDTFESEGLPGVKFYQEVVIDATDNETKKVKKPLVGLMQEALDAGVITLEDVSTTSALLRALRDFSIDGVIPE